MVRRPFFGLGRPKLKYLSIADQVGGIKEVGLPSRVTLMVKGCDMAGAKVKVGASVKTGQRLLLSDDPGGYVISTVTGTVSQVGDYTGYLNQSYGTITIDVSGEDQWDDVTLEAVKEPTFEVARDYLGSISGKSDFSSLLDFQPPVNTVVVSGMDQDLLVCTSRQVVRSDVEGLIEGIEYLKKIAKVGRVVLVVPPALSALVEQAGAVVKEVKPVYPNSLPGMIAKDVLGADYRPGLSFEQMGLGFVSAEAVICLAALFSRGEYPVDKVVTVIGKDGSQTVVKARIGTSVGDILSFLGIDVAHGDAVVFGGPMAGRAVYSLDMPIMADTDAVMVQDGSQVELSADVQCINCGECVRACPVKVPVNMLVRVLSSSLYEEAAEQYDLQCCIECGLCSYVCVARIPIFHHIMLGKHEFSRLKNLEGSNA